MKTNADNQYDVVIIGGGPAGYAAALYCARAALRTLVLEKLSAGGQMATTDEVENYPGFPEGIGGFELGVKMKQGAERFGVITKMEDVTRCELKRDVKIIETTDGKYEVPAVILATGAVPRELGLAREREMRGRGVSYCATCDGMFFRGKTVIVAGGGNTAVADVLYLSKMCEKVMLVHRRDTLRAAKSYLDPLAKCDNIEYHWDSVVTEIIGDTRVAGAMLRDVRTGEQRQVACDGIFVAVGNVPSTGLFVGQLDMDEQGYILAGETTETCLPGVFAAGDLRHKPLRQIVTAVADGAVASKYAEEYLARRK